PRTVWTAPATSTSVTSQPDQHPSTNFRGAALVPLTTSAGNEQAHNATHLAETGAALALIGEATSERLRKAVSPLLADPARRTEMAARARAQGRPDAAERLVDLVLSVARR
ncbi:glycosyltransferase, partial [Streptomyces sp. NPDC005356]|uniref:glycosyltransferase n=1 Tax=Streptomyces sp. NPDC005356 TaxID=3157167 RepID=UPI0033AF5A8C